MKRDTWLCVGTGAFVFLMFSGLFVLQSRRETVKEARSGPILDTYKGNKVEVFRDESRSVTCYVYLGSAISCVRDHGK